jgi:adenylylsulfate reductase subunit B
MSIEIDSNKCVSCGKCRNVCPGSLIYEDTKGKAFNKYPKDCWGCTACLKECPVSAIKFSLAEDIGGKGGYLYTSEDGKEYLNWHIFDKNGNEEIIKISRKESNKY